MKATTFLTAVVLVSGLALASSSRDSIESVKSGAAAAFSGAQEGIPVKANQPLNCSASIRFSTPGWGGRCSFNRVVTEVQLVNGQLNVSCGELEVSCR